MSNSSSFQENFQKMLDQGDFKSNFINKKPSQTNSNQQIKSNRQNNENNTKQAVREGDWVCLICKNLNFSFRNECNRCKIQTKQSNYIQQLIQQTFSSKLYDSQSNLLQSQRKPLDDLTNKFYANKQQNQNNEDNIQKTQLNDSNKEKQNDNKEIKEVRLISKDSQFFNQTKESLGYQSCILLTPQKYDFKSFLEQVSPFNPSNNKQEPYKSPQNLPSISPLIKLINENRTQINGSIKQKKPGLQQEKQIENESEYFVKKEIRDQQRNSVQLSPFILEEEKCLDIQVNLGQNDLKKKDFQKKKKGQKEKKKDWICPFCMNLNYSFRVFCNRCNLYSIQDF